MNRLFQLFRVQRNRSFWNSWLALTGRRRNNGAIWTLVSLGVGAAAAAMVGARRRPRIGRMTTGPMQNMIRGLNRWMGRQMGTTRVAPAEFAEEITPRRPGGQGNQ
ncbi:hypothetical protein M493_10315 [Geobacillus genomosp. 3]|uniref:Uncharacterized protein n=1 Tax=Geobacillus genomosp. 3 TaxID=1921421 RepID=S5Z065_GEOG3|nr:hypothetical protein [Geobacillus genomosp. 3]AGT32324.1 hypothetical protein M493_10315 [Geobacillus genomosp. 3]